MTKSSCKRRNTFSVFTSTKSSFKRRRPSLRRKNGKNRQKMLKKNKKPFFIIFCKNLHIEFTNFSYTHITRTRYFSPMIKKKTIYQCEAMKSGTCVQRSGIFAPNHFCANKSSFNILGTKSTTTWASYSRRLTPTSQLFSFLVPRALQQGELHTETACQRSMVGSGPTEKGRDGRDANLRS